MVVNKLTANLMNIGFTEYEAKAYIALIKSNPATAYEIAKKSGIPTSKIYGVAAKLLEKGIIIPVNNDSKKKYAPSTPEHLIEKQKINFESTLNDIREDLKAVNTEVDQSYILNIRDYDFLINKTKNIILESEKSILLSTWFQELSMIYNELKKAERKGIKISIIHFGKIKLEVGRIFQHPIEDTIYNEKGGRGFTIVSDSAQALMGTVHEENKMEGAWSYNKGFVTLAEDYIKHDIYIMKIVNRFDKHLIKRFGINYYKLRDIWNDEEVQ